ncbi:hypothetical protein [Oculatella sp. FACHB-28]|uniref:hypothetical protein n=1 Tax=Oculatella sp. FACHB-28 TaxID=2692845 RepID=UPI0018EF9610|nr:hypothetical protein [Oculatella sp. FACHB-28]
MPDSERYLAAIFFDQAYYSFFKFEKDQNRASQVANRLNHRGDTSVITQTPKGYAIWILEPEAKPSQLLQAVHSRPRQPQRSLQQKQSYNILTSRSQYRPCHIRVPDLDKPLAAIAFNGDYYSLFKVVEDVQQAKQLIIRLSHRGDATVITKSVKGYGLWVLEPEGYVD